MIQLTEQQGKQILELITRTTFRGDEAEAVVLLKQAITKQLTPKEDTKTPSKDK